MNIMMMMDMIKRLRIRTIMRMRKRIRLGGGW